MYQMLTTSHDHSYSAASIHLLCSLIRLLYLRNLIHLLPYSFTFKLVIPDDAKMRIKDFKWHIINHPQSLLRMEDKYLNMVAIRSWRCGLQIQWKIPKGNFGDAGIRKRYENRVTVFLIFLFFPKFMFTLDYELDEIEWKCGIKTIEWKSATKGKTWLVTREILARNLERSLRRSMPRILAQISMKKLRGVCNL